MSKATKLHRALKSGRKMSRRQITAWFGLANPSAAILRFEQSGDIVIREYTTKKIKGQNIRTVTYSIS